MFSKLFVGSADCRLAAVLQCVARVEEEEEEAGGPLCHPSTQSSVLANISRRQQEQGERKVGQTQTNSDKLRQTQTNSDKL